MLSNGWPHPNALLAYSPDFLSKLPIKGNLFLKLLCLPNHLLIIHRQGLLILLTGQTLLLRIDKMRQFLEHIDRLLLKVFILLPLHHILLILPKRIIKRLSRINENVFLNPFKLVIHRIHKFGRVIEDHLQF